LGDTTHPEVDEVLAGYYVDEEPDPWLTSEPRANATLVMLARNKDVQGALNSVRKLEDRFNRRRRYPWVFLNDEPFNEEFKRYVLCSFSTSSPSQAHD
jgi:alpha 1,2-mannosyltransferase